MFWPDLSIENDLLFCFVFSWALSALYGSIKPNYNVIVNNVAPKQKNAHNRPDLWDRGSVYLFAARNNSVAFYCI